MNMLVTGANGQLGFEMRKFLVGNCIFTDVN